jgi:protein phosphatase
MEIYGLSDVGLKRENNEDSFRFSKAGKYGIVADGMGGHLGGEVASEMCTVSLSEMIEKQLSSFNDPESVGNFLIAAVSEINNNIFRRSREQSELHGMGTTLSCMVEFDGRVILMNVGDSRIYRVRKGEISQVTQDDSIVWELFLKGEITRWEQRVHPLKNVITKAIGTERDINLSVEEMEYLPDDYYILCTDGLTDMLEDEEILKITTENKKPAKICRKLIKQANQNGGRDNITVVVVKL